MSKIGIKPIQLPSGVTFTRKGNLVVIKGPKGELSYTLPVPIEVTLKEDQIIVSRKNNDKSTRALHGLVRSDLNNLVEGVQNGFEKRLEIKGVGFRARLEGNVLVLELGFSHPVKVAKPEGIEFRVVKNIIVISGIDKKAVGATAAKIRALRPPEPYKGKGIMYQGEQIRRKVGKAVGAEEGAAGAGGAAAKPAAK